MGQVGGFYFIIFNSPKNNEEKLLMTILFQSTRGCNLMLLMFLTGNKILISGSETKIFLKTLFLQNKKDLAGLIF
jgi:hypothetical protein